jgi:pimeloyl-ACP methyl ester carboxylesterase
MKIQAGNAKINVETRGSGRILFLIHGFPLNLEMWQPQIERFSEHNRVIALDLRGHGQTPPTPGPYTMDLLADDCVEVLSALGVKEPVVVCGLSMGGYISFALYRRYPHIFSGLILAATRAGSDTDQTRNNREKAIKDTQQYGSAPVLDNMLKVLLAPRSYHSNPELVDNLAGILSQTSVEGIIAAQEGMKSRPDSSSTLGEIQVPTLIFHGEQDQIISEDESKYLAAGIPDSMLEIIPNAGHMLNLEQPGLFNDAADRFLSSI